MPTTGAVETVTAGAVTHVMATTLPSGSAFDGSPSWPTTWERDNQTLTFGAPAPAGGGTFGWIAWWA